MIKGDRLSRALASGQHNVISRRQAREVGLFGEALQRRVEWGEWDTPTPRVLVLAGSPATFERDATIALFDAGCLAALSIDTALAMWGVAGFARRPIHLSRDRRSARKALPGTVLHHPRLLPEHHLVRLNGLPVTTPTRTLADLAGQSSVHPRRVERAINNAWAARLTSRAALERMADEWCERGRSGSAFLHEYLATRAPGWKPPDSSLEDRFITLITEAGMPAPLSQINVGDEESRIGRIDCRDPEFAWLLAEVDSERFHVAPLDVEADAERDARLKKAGFDIERFGEFEVWHNGSVVVDRWREARRRAAHAARRR